MSDIFLSRDLHALLKNKKVVFMGDSNVRSYYKDMLCLNSHCQIIHQKSLKSKMENSVFGDRMMRHGEKINGREYREERKFASNGMHFEFYFITRVFNDYVKEIVDKVVSERQPDVLIINSCLWDMCRWGPNGVSEYKENVVKLMKYLKKLLNEKCLVIWTTAPPLSSNVRGGFLVIQLDFLKYCLRFHVMEANTYCRKVVVDHGYDVLDIHYHLRMQLQRRCSDGIHWLPTAVRYITNLLLTHISLAWGVPLPHRYESVITQRTLVASDAIGDEEICQPNKKQKKDKQKKAKKKSNAVGPSYHQFERNERQKQARQRISNWSKNRQSFRPVAPASVNPWNVAPMQPCAPGNRPLLGRFPGDSYRAPLPLNNSLQNRLGPPVCRPNLGPFDFTDSNLPFVCMF